MTYGSIPSCGCLQFDAPGAALLCRRRVGIRDAVVMNKSNRDIICSCARSAAATCMPGRGRHLPVEAETLMQKEGASSTGIAPGRLADGDRSTFVPGQDDCVGGNAKSFTDQRCFASAWRISRKQSGTTACHSRDWFLLTTDKSSANDDRSGATCRHLARTGAQVMRQALLNLKL